MQFNGDISDRVEFSFDHDTVTQNEKFSIMASKLDEETTIQEVVVYLPLLDVKHNFSDYFTDIEVQTEHEFEEEPDITLEEKSVMISFSVKTAYKEKGKMFSISFTVKNDAPYETVKFYGTGTNILLDDDWGAGKNDVELVIEDRSPSLELPILQPFDFEENDKGYYYTGGKISVINVPVDREDTKYDVTIKKDNNEISKENYDTNGICVDKENGELSVTQTGNYTVDFTCKESYKWKDCEENTVSYTFLVKEEETFRIDINDFDAAKQLLEKVGNGTSALTIQLTGTGEKTISLTEPLKIPVGRMVTIEGPSEGSVTLLQGNTFNTANGLIEVPAGSTLNLSNITVDADGKGRVIYNMGTVHLTDAVIQNGYLQEISTSVYAENMYGAGICNGAGATVELENSDISENTISCEHVTTHAIVGDIEAHGAAIYNAKSGTVLMNDSNISSNSVFGTTASGSNKCQIYGVAIDNEGTFSISGGTISNNVMTAMASRQNMDYVYGVAIASRHSGSYRFQVENCKITGNKIVDEKEGPGSAYGVASYGIVYKRVSGSELSFEKVEISENIQEIPNGKLPIYGTVYIERDPSGADYDSGFQMTDTVIRQNTVTANEENDFVYGGGLCAGASINIAGEIIVDGNECNDSPSDFVFTNKQSHVAISSELADGSVIPLNLASNIRESFESGEHMAAVKPGTNHPLTEQDYSCFSVQGTTAESFQLIKNTADDSSGISAIVSFDLTKDGDKSSEDSDKSQEDGDKSSEDGDKSQEDGATVSVTGVTLNKTSLSLAAGKSETLTATVNPTSATNKNVTWTSSNTKVATVNAGKVTAVAAGTATITVKTADGDKTATCNVTVTPATVAVTKVTNVSLSKTSLTIAKGKSTTLAATVTPTNATNKAVTWTSSNTKVATVTSTGTVKGIKAGKATITATAKDGSGKKATCTVTVTQVTLNATSMALQVKKSTTALKATTSLKTDKVTSWTSSNTKVATVGKTTGKVTAKKIGTAKITVTTKSGATATCTVKVQKAKVVTKKLSISSKKLTLKKGKKATLTVTRNPISATEKITWKSSNKKVATVTNKGKVTAKKAGTATITAKSSNGKKVTCKVTVKK